MTSTSSSQLTERQQVRRKIWKYGIADCIFAVGNSANNTPNAMTHTKHDFTERTTSNLKLTMTFVQGLLASAKEAIVKEQDPEQHAAWAKSIADYKAGIAAIQAELQTR